MNQILDAALAESSTRRFTFTRIDDIAAPVVLSEGGLYTHFESKEEVFQALLRRPPVTSILDERALAQGSHSGACDWPAVRQALHMVDK
ncbi:TetR family transcriptional regulator [Caballeronia sp. LjRoot34]|uniref:TetR family transcriptional regulator n=1 Tax=Caballeronia sp. LjRoot34 TaxID=3342325 RepID=UPI003ECC75D8